MNKPDRKTSANCNEKKIKSKQELQKVFNENIYMLDSCFSKNIVLIMVYKTSGLFFIPLICCLYVHIETHPVEKKFSDNIKADLCCFQAGERCWIWMTSSIVSPDPTFSAVKIKRELKKTLDSKLYLFFHIKLSPPPWSEPLSSTESISNLQQAFRCVVWFPNVYNAL